MSLPRLRNVQKPYGEPLWRIRPRPQTGECFSSWILRIAAKRGKLPFQIIDELAPGLQLWNRDTDLLAPPRLRDLFVEATGVGRERIDALCLSSLIGILDENIDGVNQSQHIRPVGTYHRTRRSFGQQFCPQCLLEGEPYFRLRWRLTLFPVCTRHGIILRDACEICAAPVVPHRKGMFACHQCGADHSVAPSATATSDVIQHQAQMEMVLEGSAVSQPYLRGIHPLAYFAIQLRILSTLIKRGRGGNLRTSLPAQIRPAEPDFRGGRRESRYLTPSSTHEYMRAVVYLLRGFPIMLVAACQEAGVFKSWLLSDARNRIDPYALKSAADHYLSPGSANNRSRY